MSGIDGTIRNSVLSRPVARSRSAHARRVAARERFETGFVHEPGDELRFVDFKGSKEQVTPYSLALSRPRWTRFDEPNPWPVLATRYPADLVERMERLYAEGAFA